MAGQGGDKTKELYGWDGIRLWVDSAWKGEAVIFVVDCDFPPVVKKALEQECATWIIDDSDHRYYQCSGGFRLEDYD